MHTVRTVRTIGLAALEHIFQVQVRLVHRHALCFVHRDAPGQVERHLRALRDDRAAQRDREELVADHALDAIAELHHGLVGFPVQW